MSDITEMLIKSTNKIMKDICTKEMVNEAEQGAWAAELWDTLAESGMITVAVPEENGGIGGSYRDALSILRLAGKYSAPIPLAETYVGNWLLASLGRQVSDEPLTIAYPRDNERFHFQQHEEGWVITGKASLVPWARYAKQMIMIGQTGASENVLALVTINEAKIELGQNLAGEARDTVEFDQVLVNDGEVIPVDYPLVKNQLWYTGALTRAVMMAGALERILELTVTYTTERNQFGRPIHRFQAVQQQLALLAGETAAAGTAAEYAIEAFEVGLLDKEIAMAKIRVNEAVGSAAAMAHQVHGAIGFTHEHILHQSTRRLWSWRDEYGTETEWGEKLADQLIEAGPNGLWSLLTK